MEDKRVTLDVLKVESAREDHWQPRNMEDRSITLDVEKRKDHEKNTGHMRPIFFLSKCILNTFRTFSKATEFN